ncbi:LytR/AlgR family response regulator transcription factor [Gilvibacter sediminis]|uniref:LytR/AlgR family response regulator transcription factor n=1 Tax=Gilvibacter sediminis TaxID=379071 RepID=UPI0023502F7C|nr:LytTR family DNA-binding domain-containing protein [Gilvibacter sediminis]MDC7997136.1 LytTR family DNA-binding domain-containing protein [Gilvibacter sediminis]
MLNRKVAYTSSWSKTLIVGLILGLILPLIIILLKPFDSEQYSASFKYLRIFGYAGVVAVCVLIVHAIENFFYLKSSRQWKFWQELVVLLVAAPIMVCLSGVYNFYVINSESNLSWSWLADFLVNFGLPFAPLLIPAWAALRRHFGKISLETTTPAKSERYSIQGVNKTDQLTLDWNGFLYAQAQQNYVKFVCLKDGQLESTMIRSTLAAVSAQLPSALQVHRSYLVNADFVTQVAGNSRNRHILLKSVEEPIPVSKKYYEAFSERLSNSSQ